MRGEGGRRRFSKVEAYTSMPAGESHQGPCLLQAVDFDQIAPVLWRVEDLRTKIPETVFAFIQDLVDGKWWLWLPLGEKTPIIGVFSMYHDFLTVLMCMEASHS